MQYTAEAYNTRKTTIAEQACPSEIGGYAFSTDTGGAPPANPFHAAFANAGGTSMAIALNGDTTASNGNNYAWTSLGVNRFGRVNWDTRLGPSDGAYNIAAGGTTQGFGVSFGPTRLSGGVWQRLASNPGTWSGVFTTTLATPVSM